MYSLEGDDTVFEWLSNESSEPRREALLAFLPVLAADPMAPHLTTVPVPALAYPVFLTEIPGQNLGVVYLRNDFQGILKVREVVDLV